MYEIVWIRINYHYYQKLSNVAPASKRHAYFKYFSFLKVFLVWSTSLLLFPSMHLCFWRRYVQQKLTKQAQTGYHKQLVITYSLHIHCNNQMQTDWLVKALQLNITIIIFKEAVSGYDPFSTIFVVLLQMVKVTFILSHLRKPFSIWSIYSFSSNSSSYLLYTFIVLILVLVLSLRKILVLVLVLRQNTVLVPVPVLELELK